MHPVTWQIGTVFILARSACVALINACSTFVRLALFTISIKSTAIMPPISRSLICSESACAASRLVASAVASMSLPFVERAELTSHAVSASVLSIQSFPPDGILTSLLSSSSL